MLFLHLEVVGLRVAGADGVQGGAGILGQQGGRLDGVEVVLAHHLVGLGVVEGAVGRDGDVLVVGHHFHWLRQCSCGFLSFDGCLLRVCAARHFA